MTIWVDGRRNNDVESVTTVSGPLMYRATIVPDKKTEWDGGTLVPDMTEEELIQFIRDYGICNGIRDLTDAANALDKIRKRRE